MRKWVVEDWEFELIATEGNAEQCRAVLKRETGSFFRMSALRECVQEL